MGKRKRTDRCLGAEKITGMLTGLRCPRVLDNNRILPLIFRISISLCTAADGDMSNCDAHMLVGAGSLAPVVE